MQNITIDGIWVDVGSGSHIIMAINEAIQLANDRKQKVVFDFNGIIVKVAPAMNRDDALMAFDRKRSELRKK